MSLYLETYRDISSPIVFSNSLLPGILWKGLNLFHRIWWVKKRKEQIFENSDPVLTIFKMLVQTPIIDNRHAMNLGQLLLIIVKTEEAFKAYNSYCKSYLMIRQTWRGDFSIGKQPLHKKFLLTSYKICLYVVESFCLTMTVMDVIDAFVLSSKTKFEASLRLTDNIITVVDYYKMDSEVLSKRLWPYKPILETVFRKINRKETAEDFIITTINSHKSTKKVTSLASKIITPCVNVIYQSIDAQYIQPFKFYRGIFRSIMSGTLLSGGLSGIPAPKPRFHQV